MAPVFLDAAFLGHMHRHAAKLDDLPRVPPRTSMSHYPEWEAYKERTWWLVLFAL